MEMYLAISFGLTPLVPAGKKMLATWNMSILGNTFIYVEIYIHINVKIYSSHLYFIVLSIF